MSPRAEPILPALFPEQNPSPVLRMSRDGTLLYANAGAAFLLEDWHCSVGEGGPECLREAVAAALDQGAASGVEIKSRGRDISFVVAPLADLACANLYGHDITGRKQAEEALRRLNDELAQRVAEQTTQISRDRQRLQEVVDLLPVYAILLTPDYHVPVANRFFRERFGESEGRRCYEYLFNRTEPCEACEGFAVLKTNAPHRWEWTGPDGRYYDIHDFPFRDSDGSNLILEVGLDITERKRAEAELEKHRDHLAELVAERTAQLERANLELQTEVADRKRAEVDLRQSREDLSRAQEVGQIGSWRLDVRRNILTWSDENHRIFGIPPGTPLSYETFLSSVHPDDRSYVDRKWKAGLRGEPYDVEHRLLVDGHVKWVREKAYLEFDESGELLGGFGITQDITERKLIEEERALQARLKDEFLALLGHELRNPLAAISTAVRLLSNGVTAERRSSLDEMIDRQVTILQRLVDDLLDLARVTHGQIDLKKERVDLAELLQRVAAAARSSVAGRGQELILRMPSERVLFLADGVRLEQIATNLLNNASKYTAHGGRIELSGAREGSEVVIRCKDNGRGIPLGMQRMIFEPFARGQTAGESTEAGIGIGLTLVRRLAELHGGTVTVESGGAGAGSEFTVRMPLVTPPPASREVTATRARRTVRGRSVAIVEDNADVAQALAIGLEQAGHKVRLFADGPSALSGLTRLKPHAILLDIGLPGMDGYELAARLRKRQNLKRALFVGISGFKRRAQGGKTGDGFDQYFVKPVDLDKLLAFLETGTGHTKQPPVRRSVKPLRVLLVEDNADLAKVTAELLRGDGLEVRTALSGREALAAAVDFQPQLTICDLRLPDMPGLEVVRSLRSRPATRRTYTVILTAMGESEVAILRRRAKAMGIDQFVAKPLTSNKLQELIPKLKTRRR